MAATKRARRASDRSRSSRRAAAGGSPRVRTNGDATESHGARPIWSGTLSFGLVAVPVNLFPAVRPPELALRLLAPSGAPVQRHYVDPEAGKDAPYDELVRGYEVDVDKYVVLTDAELEAIAPRKSRDIDLRRFVPREELDPFLFERAYVLTPGGESNKPYRLLAEAMEQGGKAGVATFVMRSKEYLVAIVAHRGILWAETLRFAGEVRTPKDVGLPKPADVDAKDVASFVRTIQAHARDGVSRDDLVERRSEKLRALAERKLAKGQDVVEPEVALDDAAAAPPEPSEAPDLFASIRRSLQVLQGGGGNGAGAEDGEARTRGAAPVHPINAGARRRASPRSKPASSGRSRATGRRPRRRAPAR